MKRPLTQWVGLMWILIQAFNSPPPFSPQTLQRVRDATVFIAVPLVGTSVVPQGSGVVISPEGWILTNAHLISGWVKENTWVGPYPVLQIEVYLHPGTPTVKRMLATPVFTLMEEGLDIALLKIPVSGLDFLSLEPVGSYHPGERIWAMGYPGGALGSVNPNGPEPQIASGLIASLSYSPSGNPRLIYHNAPIVAGYSGGPLLNSEGELIGINGWAIGARTRLAFAVADLESWIGPYLRNPNSGVSTLLYDSRGVEALSALVSPSSSGIDLSKIDNLQWTVPATHLTTPLVTSNGWIFFDRNIYSSERGLISQIVAVSPEGKTQWKTDLPGRISPPLVSDNQKYLYAVSGASLYQLNLEDGKITRQFTPHTGFLEPPLFSPDGNLILYGAFPEIIQMTPEGKVRWRFKKGVNKAPRVDENGNLYFVAAEKPPTPPSTLIKLSPEGKIQWAEQPGGTILGSPTLLNSFPWIYLNTGDIIGYTPQGNLLNRISVRVSEVGLTPLGDSAILAVRLPDGALCAFSSDGSLKWSFQPDKENNYFGPPRVDSTGRIAIVSHNYIGREEPETLYLLSSGGELLWKMTSTGSVSPSISDPVFSPDGSLYLVVRSDSHYQLISVKLPASGQKN